MENNEQDELWHLLGRARQPAVSPFFARNVVRAVRALKEKEGTSFSTWLRSFRWSLAGAAAAFVAVIAVQNFLDEPQQPQFAHNIATDPDYEVIVNLDELLAYEDNVWLDTY